MSYKPLVSKCLVEGCDDQEVAQWRHSANDCKGYLEINELKLTRCSKCNDEKHLHYRKFECGRHKNEEGKTDVGKADDLIKGLFPRQPDGTDKLLKLAVLVAIFAMPGDGEPPRKPK